MRLPPPPPTSRLPPPRRRRRRRRPGVDSLNNILIIGMTNRKDMMDEALLRPGRFEVQVQISLPDAHGRLQILRIHTAKMDEAGYLDKGVDLEELAQGSKNFSGAEIEGLVKSASSYALARTTGGGDVKKIDLSALKARRAVLSTAPSRRHLCSGRARQSSDRVVTLLACALGSWRPSILQRGHEAPRLGSPPRAVAWRGREAGAQAAH